MTAPKRSRGPAIPEMTDLQLLAHLIHMAGTDLTQARAAAHGLLNDHKDLEAVLDLPRETLLGNPELGENAAAFLLLLPALARRYASAGLDLPPAERPWGPERAVEMLVPHFQDRSLERVCVFCLGRDFQLISGVTVAQGDALTVSCSVSTVLRLALTHHSGSVILAHNHPDGVAAFSKSDLLATAQLAHALATVGISLADHLLLAGDLAISLRGLRRSGGVESGCFTPSRDWLESGWPLRTMQLPPPPERT